MTAAAWGDPVVTQALREVVQGDDGAAGEGPRVQAEGLLEALMERLGDRAEEFADAVSALVAAAEVGVPQGVLDDVPAIDLGDRLDEAGFEPEVAGWVLTTWGQVLRTPPSRATPALEAPVVAPEPEAEAEPEPEAEPRPVLPNEETRPLPRVEAEIATAEVLAAEDARADDGGTADEAAAEEAREEFVGIRTVPRRSRLPVPTGVLVAVAAVVGIGVAGAFAMTAGGGNDPVTSTTSPARTSSAAPSPSAPASLATPLAHAGGGETFPLQTQPALLDAAARGDIVEADLRWTLDGVPVLYDAASVKGRMACDREYAVALTSFATLKSSCRTAVGASKDGKRYGIPAFDATVKKLSKVAGVQLYIEMKVDQTPAQVSTFLGVLRRNDMAARTVVTSFDADRLAAVRQAATASKTKGLRYLQFVRDADLSAKAAAKADLDAVGVRYDAVTADYVKKLHAAGLEVVVWTLNKPAQWAKARELGVDGVLTDRPAAYRTWYAKPAR